MDKDLVSEVENAKILSHRKNLVDQRLPDRQKVCKDRPGDSK